MNYKFSIYNHWGLLSSGDYLIYNLVSSSIAVLTKTELMELQSIHLASSVTSQDLFHAALSEGFVVPTEENEAKKVIALRNINNFNNRIAGFQILPTTMCNARCFYCYEEGFTPSTMSEDTRTSTIRFIKGFAENLDELHITWFGGEPMLGESMIKDFSSSVIPFLDERGIKYYASMITNGSLISEKNVDIFVNQYRISDVQITLDGKDLEYQNRKRYQSEVSYASILHVIELLASRKIRVLVRLNVDKNNFENCLEVLYDLQNLKVSKDYIWPYIAPLYAAGGNSTCFSSDELNDIFSLGFRKLIDTGFIQTLDGLPLNFINATCCAQMINNYVITPSGNIVKCEHLLENEDEVVGSVFNGIVFNDAMERWSDPSIPENCQCCTYLPICQAGCFAGEKMDFGYGRCSYVRFIDKAIIDAADYLLRKQAF